MCDKIQYNEFSQVTLSTHLTHPFITSCLLFYLCSLRQKILAELNKFLISKGSSKSSSKTLTDPNEN